MEYGGVLARPLRHPVQSLPGPEVNFRHASYLNWLTRNLLRGGEPTVALGYE
jgi:hypothetical protein